MLIAVRTQSDTHISRITPYRRSYQKVSLGACVDKIEEKNIEVDQSIIQATGDYYFSLSYSVYLSILRHN